MQLHGKLCIAALHLDLYSIYFFHLPADMVRTLDIFFSF